MHRHLIVVGIAILLSACVAPDGDMESLGDRDSTAILPVAILDDLRPGEGDFAPDLVYVTDKARATSGSYDKILIDPMMYFAPLGQKRRLSSSDRQVLLNNFQILMARQLEKDFRLVQDPQPGTVRVQFAVLPATREPVAMDTVAMVARRDPNKEVVTESFVSPLVHGADLLVEAEWTDAVTGEVLGATVDRHFGQRRFNGGELKSWADVNRYLEAYAQLIRYRLCRFRERTDCVAPGAPLG